MARLGSGQLGAGMLARVVRVITVITGRCCWTLDTALMTSAVFPRVSPAWCLAWRSCYRVADGRSSARGNISKIGNW